MNNGLDKPRCARCGWPCSLSRGEAADNHVQAFWWCGFCDTMGTPKHPFVSRHTMAAAGIEIGELPVVLRFPNGYKPVCERCGHEGAQLHHWAPQALFEDAWDWPMSYLCRQCHALWHKRVRA